MTSPSDPTRPPSKFGDRSTSDVVVRLRTQDGRDDWVYCHSPILVEKSKYFADRLSDNWPTCQIIDSRNCVDLHCNESDFDYHVTVLRLFYVSMDNSVTDLWNGVRNALGVLRVAVQLGCPHITAACVEYLEAVPWEEGDEEEILRIIPGMGSQVEPILARLQPVNPNAILKIFFSAIRFATSSLPSNMNDIKVSAQEQLDYMISEDDDPPLLTVNDDIKFEVRECARGLLARFNNQVESLLCEPKESSTKSGNVQLILICLTDLSWVAQILYKFQVMNEFVNCWTDASENVVKVVEQVGSKPISLEMKLRATEVTAKVLETLGYGTVVLPTAKRFHLVKVWLPFVRVMKPLIDAVPTDSDDDSPLKADDEMWQSLESAFVSIILALPSTYQAEILSDWLRDEHVKYPDLTEAFEVWCYRSKVAKRRLGSIGGINGKSDSH